MSIEEIPANKNFYRGSKKQAFDAMVDFIKHESLWGERGHGADAWMFGNNLLALHLKTDFVTFDVFWALKVQIKQRFNIDLYDYSMSIENGTLKIAFKAIIVFSLY